MCTSTRISGRRVRGPGRCRRSPTPSRFSGTSMSAESYDVIVVGGGNAALCAALSAKETAKRVLLLERAPEDESGGNSRFTAGLLRIVYNGADDLAQLIDLSKEERERTDFGTYTADQFLDDMARVTEYRCDSDLTEILVKQSFPTALWMRKKGMRFTAAWGRQAFKIEGKFKFWGGLTLEAIGGGPGLVDSLTQIAKKNGVEVWYQARAISLIADDCGVHGVVAKHKGKTLSIKSKAVVLAAGGEDHRFRLDRQGLALVLRHHSMHAAVVGDKRNRPRLVPDLDAVLLRDLGERVHQPRTAADRLQRQPAPELELPLDLERLPAPRGGETHAFLTHPKRGGETLLDQDLGQIGVAAVLGDTRHVVEELVGGIRAEVGALALLLRQVDQLREVVGAVVDDAQQPGGEARIPAGLVLRRALEHEHALRRLLRRQRGAQGGVAAADYDHVIGFSGHACPRKSARCGGSAATPRPPYPAAGYSRRRAHRSGRACRVSPRARAPP